MRKSRRNAAATPARSAARLGWVLPFGLVILAAAISAWDAAAIWSFWWRMPAGQERRVAERLASGFGEAEPYLRSFPQFDQAGIVADAGQQIAKAERDSAKRTTLRTALARQAAALRSTQLGRVQQALAALLELEGQDATAEQRWTQVKGYLEGLERATFAHFQSESLRAWAAAYDGLGADPGTAAQFARRAMRAPLGQFLQMLIPRLRTLADDSAAAGNAAAADTCRRISRRLLKQWVLDDGPTALRLLAADLLARELTSASDIAPTTEAAALADDLKKWRAAYLDAAARRPIALLDVAPDPALAPREHTSLLHWVVLTLCMAGASLGTALLTVLTGWAWVGRVGSALSRGRAALVLSAAVVIVLGAAVLWLNAAPDAVNADVRRLTFSGDGWPRHPLAAVMLVVAVLGGAAFCFARGGWRGRLTVAGQLAICAWVGFGVLTAACVGMSELARRHYERASAAAAVDEYRALAGDQTALLARLRAWEP